ncbi:hypothetical protein BJX63DRAFT_404669 [Aspergillus granulosus]|uniref:Uncharacterized protein n=1 Tax=Aspergillus granulosus TaxID=176169 RepID=A0ABR4H2K8_9EURO
MSSPAQRIRGISSSANSTCFLPSSTQPQPMSRTRPPNFQKWSSLHCRSNVLLAAQLRLSNSHPIDIPLPPHSRNNQRPFHSTTPSSYATPVRSPAAQRAQQRPNAVRRSGPIPPGGALPDRPGLGLKDTLNARLRILEKAGLGLMTEMLKDGIIDKSVTPRKFKHVTKALLESALSGPPSKDCIDEIARDADLDVDTIFEIGRAVTRDDKALSHWIITACTLAGARMALFLTATQYLRGCHDQTSVLYATSTTSPARNPLLDQIQALATRSDPEGVDNRDPRAMLIHAKVLGLRRRFTPALALVEEVMQRIQPTRMEMKANTDLTVSSRIEPPWELYLWLMRASKGTTRGKSSSYDPDGPIEGLTENEIDVLRRGAVDYLDPVALRLYADVMRQQGDFRKYEEYMGQAAAAGNRDASRKLANLYILISLQQHPRPGESVASLEAGTKAAETPKGFLAKVLSYFGPRPLPEYRSLAMEWYRVAWAAGCVRSGLNLAILFRQDGNIEQSDAILEEAQGLARGQRSLNAQVQRLAAIFALGESQTQLQYLDL